MSTDSTVPSGQTVVSEIPAKDTADFSTIGLNWSPESSSGLSAQIRTRSGDSWSDWQTLEVASDPDTEAATRVGTDPIYVGESDGVQARVLASDATASVVDPQVSLIDPGTSDEDAHPATVSTAAASSSSAPSLAARPTIVSRKGWSADESWRCGEKQIGETIRGAIVHHTAGVNSYSAAEAPGIVRGIYAYHTKTLGWCDIGYNFLVDKYGTIYEGRYGGVTLPVHGAHATDWNTDTVGVSFMGNFETAAPTSTMLTSAAKLLAWKFDGYYVNPTGKVTLAGKNINTISGHRDVMSTACPGRNVYSKMGSLRSDVAQRMGSYATPNQKKWASTSLSYAGPIYIGEQALAGGRWTQATKMDLYSTDATGSHYTRGEIRKKYHDYGPTSLLGWPTQDERKAWPFSDSWVSVFEGGSILYSSSTKAWTMVDPYWKKYKIGSVHSRIQLPTAERTKKNPLGIYTQEFENGRLYNSNSTVTYVYGDLWKSLKVVDDARVKKFGRPTTDPYTTKTQGVQAQLFQGVSVYWTAGGRRVVEGSINKEYQRLGAENSRLGLPTSKEIKAGPSAWYSTFEHGRIDRANGVTTVTYN